MSKSAELADEPQISEILHSEGVKDIKIKTDSHHEAKKTTVRDQPMSLVELVIADTRQVS